MAGKELPHIDPNDLIELVEERPCLWDKTCSEYKNRLTKEKAWNEVFEHFYFYLNVNDEE